MNEESIESSAARWATGTQVVHATLTQDVTFVDSLQSTIISK